MPGNITTAFSESAHQPLPDIIFRVIHRRYSHINRTINQQKRRHLLGIAHFFAFFFASLIFLRCSSVWGFPFKVSLVFLRVSSEGVLPNNGCFSPFFAALSFLRVSSDGDLPNIGLFSPFFASDIFLRASLVWCFPFCISLIFLRVSSDMTFPLCASLILLRVSSGWCFPKKGCLSPFLASLIFLRVSAALTGSFESVIQGIFCLDDVILFGISSLTCPILLIEKQNPDQPESPKEDISVRACRGSTPQRRSDISTLPLPAYQGM